MARSFFHPSPRDVTIDGILHALADPTRRDILCKLLSCDGMNCSDACHDGLPPSTISHHHKILREAGLIHSEKKGVEVINTVRRAEIDRKFPGLIDTVMAHHKHAKAKAKVRKK